MKIAKPTTGLNFFLLSLTVLFMLAGCGGSATVKPPVDAAAVDAAAVRVDRDVEEKFEEANEALKAGDYDRAIELLNALLAVEKRLAAPYINLGMAYARKGDDRHAEEYLRKAVDIDLGHPVANNELGMLYRKLGRFDDAQHAYNNALAQHGDYLPAIRNLGILCELYLQDMECALQQYERFLEQVPDDRNVAIWVADIKRRAGQ